MSKDREQAEKEWAAAVDQFSWGACLFSEIRDGDILLVPMRVGKPATPERTITITPLAGDSPSLWQSGPPALQNLEDCQRTCSMCSRYRAFRDIPNQGWCVCQNLVSAFQNQCINYKDR